jgi:hypothetical protein
VAVPKALGITPDNSCMADMIGYNASNTLGKPVVCIGSSTYDGRNNYTRQASGRVGDEIVEQGVEASEAAGYAAFRFAMLRLDQAACVSSPEPAGRRMSPVSLTSSKRTETRLETPDSCIVTP